MLFSSLFATTNANGRLSLSHWNTIAVLRFITSTTFSSKSSSSSDEQQQQQLQGRSFVESYLVNSCGLSPQAASSVSTTYNNKLNFHSSQNPDSVLSLLTKHGLSQTQISTLVRTRPLLLNSNPEKTLLPKILFLSSIGISDTELARIISSNPRLLTLSLEKQLIPCHNFLKTVANLQHKQVIAAFKRRSIFTSDILNTFAPNVALLRQLGVPQSSISFLFTTYPQALALKHSRFVKAVEDSRQMGFDPCKNSFVKAIRVLYTMTDSKWESKCETFGKWGWSKDDTTEAFRRCPLIMTVSDKKINEVFDFVVNKMGWAWASKQIFQCPSILSCSLEKNIAPKCNVIRVLQLKGLMNQEISLAAILTNGEMYFLDRLLVYGYMCNESLDKWIFYRSHQDQILNWHSRRQMICDIAKGVAYLHEDCCQ